MCKSLIGQILVVIDQIFYVWYETFFTDIKVKDSPERSSSPGSGNIDCK